MKNPTKDKRIEESSMRVNRGGSWAFGVEMSTLGPFRFYGGAGNEYQLRGFRIVRNKQ